MWHRPLRKRGRSSHHTLNFLWQHDELPVFIMDNHLAAAWAWAATADLTQPHAFLHIDRHTDWLASRTDQWAAGVPAPLRELSLDEYTSATYSLDGVPTPILRWDNYIPIFCRLHPDVIGSDIVFATHDEGGDRPPFAEFDSDPWQLLANLDFWLCHRHRSAAKWILNIDADYFFAPDAENRELRWATDAYVETLFRHVRQALHKGVVASLTLSLSPECCGGWAESEEIAEIFSRTLGLSFRLPEDAPLEHRGASSAK